MQARLGANYALRDQVDRPSLSASRERALLIAVQTSTDEHTRQAALTELWESHSKLVVAIASRYRRQEVDFLDLVGAGHLGLHAAIARFDPSRYESRLSSYAIGWIRWHIQDYLNRNTTPVRLPGSTAYRQLLQMSVRLDADARRSCARDCVEPTDGEVCARIGRRIGLSADEVATGLRLIRGGAVSLHGEAPGGASVPALSETLLDSNAASEDEVILRLDHAKARKRIMSLAEEILGERERTVFFARCMTANDDVAPLASLAALLGVSAERVYQLEASAKHKIATALSREGYGAFLRDGETIRLPTTRASRRRAGAPRLDRALAIVSGRAAP